MIGEHFQKEMKGLVAEYREKAKGRGPEFAEVFNEALANSFAIVDVFSNLPGGVTEEKRRAIDASTRGLVRVTVLQCQSRFPAEEVQERAIEILGMVDELVRKINSLPEVRE